MNTAKDTSIERVSRVRELLALHVNDGTDVSDDLYEFFGDSYDPRNVNLVRLLDNTEIGPIIEAYALNPHVENKFERLSEIFKCFAGDWSEKAYCTIDKNLPEFKKAVEIADELAQHSDNLPADGDIVENDYRQGQKLAYLCMDFAKVCNSAVVAQHFKAAPNNTVLFTPDDAGAVLVHKRVAIPFAPVEAFMALKFIK